MHIVWFLIRYEFEFWESKTFIMMSYRPRFGYLKMFIHKVMVFSALNFSWVQILRKRFFVLQKNERNNLIGKLKRPLFVEDVLEQLKSHN